MGRKRKPTFAAVLEDVVHKYPSETPDFLLSLLAVEIESVGTLQTELHKCSMSPKKIAQVVPVAAEIAHGIRIDPQPYQAAHALLFNLLVLSRFDPQTGQPHDWARERVEFLGHLAERAQKVKIAILEIDLFAHKLHGEGIDHEIERELTAYYLNWYWLTEKIKQAWSEAKETAPPESLSLEELRAVLFIALVAVAARTARVRTLPRGFVTRCARAFHKPLKLPGNDERRLIEDYSRRKKDVWNPKASPRWQRVRACFERFGPLFPMLLDK